MVNREVLKGRTAGENIREIYICDALVAAVFGLGREVESLKLVRERLEVRSKRSPMGTMARYLDIKTAQIWNTAARDPLYSIQRALMEELNSMEMR
jgi:hypothetical protein